MGVYVHVCAHTCIPVGERAGQGGGTWSVEEGPACCWSKGSGGAQKSLGGAPKWGLALEQHLITQAF